MTEVLLSAWGISLAEAASMKGQSLLHVFAAFFSFGFLGPFARGLLVSLDLISFVLMCFLTINPNEHEKSVLLTNQTGFREVMAPMALPTHSNSLLWCPYYANPTHSGLLLLHIPQNCWFHFCFNASSFWSATFACLTCFTHREGTGWVLSYSLTCIADPPPNLLALEIRTPVWNCQASEMWEKSSSCSHPCVVMFASACHFGILSFPVRALLTFLSSPLESVMIPGSK